MPHSVEYTVEEMDWPIDINQPWLGSIPTVLRAVVTIEGVRGDWHVTAVVFDTTTDREAPFTKLKRMHWAQFSPAVCEYVQGMLESDAFEREAIDDLFDDCDSYEREAAAEFRAG